MKTFMYNWNKKQYSTTPSDEYIKKYTYVDVNFRHAWKPNTEYRRGDVVFDYLESKKFFIIFFGGVSSNTDSIYDDELKWDEYIPLIEHKITNFNEILLHGDITKYQEDNKYYDVYNVPTNIKIEQLAYDYYNNVDYWDILLVLNGMSTYLKLPQSNDIIIDKTIDKLTKWGNLFGYNKIDFLYLDSYLSTKTWGRDLEIRTTFLDSVSQGAYYIKKGEIVQVKDYDGRDNVLFYCQKQIPEIKIITFNPVFPLNDLDRTGFQLNGVSMIHDAFNVIPSTLDLKTDGNSLMQDYESKLIQANLLGLIYNVDYTLENITLTNNPDELNSINLSHDTATSTRNDVLNINDDDSLTVQEAIDAGYFVEVDSTYVLLDYDDEELMQKYYLLYDMYLKYFDEMNDENNKFQFLKVLKSEYINEFRLAYQNILSKE